ncbi:hypothetical protein OTU49_015573, partial [Cherax quadricarinatus]
KKTIKHPKQGSIWAGVATRNFQRVTGIYQAKDMNTPSTCAHAHGKSRRSWHGHVEAAEAENRTSSCCSRLFDWTFLLVLSSCLLIGLSPARADSLNTDKEVAPVFLEPVQNLTVSLGRDASLACTVDHLGQHKVAWIHLDRKMIVSIHNHVITREARFSVIHDSHKTWTLQVTGVLEEDRGHYMCQVNTAPMISQTGFLQVVVPPNIIDGESS